MSDIPECSGDAAAYALGALDSAEADAFQLHVGRCVVCRDELAAFQQVVDVLPMSAPQLAAPRPLRRRVLKAVRAEPRLGAARLGAAPRTRRTPRWAVPIRPLAAAGVLAAVALATLVGVELSSGGSSDTRVIQAEVAGSAASAELRLSGGRGELTVRHLPAPPAGHIYEVWVQRPHHTPAPTTALFGVTVSGAGDVGVPGNLSGASAVLVTPEPSGGSLVPTHAPVIVVPITS
jgi:anti-sigma-K factor RskA